MAITIHNVLNANVVLAGISLLNIPSELKAFMDGINVDEVVSNASLLRRDLFPNVDAERTFSLGKERITLDISLSRSILRRDYPEWEDLERLAEVAGHAIAKTDLQGRSPHAFGYNLELVYTQCSGQPAGRYLAERLFAPNLLGNEGEQLLGGTGRLTFQNGEKVWMVNLEPRFNEKDTAKVFLSLNLHQNEQRMPDENEIRASLHEIWKQARQFATRVDERGT